MNISFNKRIRIYDTNRILSVSPIPTKQHINIIMLLNKVMSQVMRDDGLINRRKVKYIAVCANGENGWQHQRRRI